MLLVAGLVRSGEARQAKTLAEIKTSKSVTVCADPDNLPFSSRDPGAPGYDVEVMRLVAAELGAEADFKWVSTVSARRALANLTEGECDMFPGLPVSPGFAEEYPRLAFSRPYYTMRHVIVARAEAGVGGVIDLRGGPTAVEALSPADLFLLGKGYPRRAYRTQEAAFAAVRSGEARTALLWAPKAGWLVQRLGVSDLTMVRVADADLAVDFGVAFLRKDQALAAALDQAIAKLRANGTIASTLGRYGVPLVDGRESARRTITPVAWLSGRARRVVRLAQAPGATPDPIEGRFLFESNCEQCHGINGRGGGAVPPLQAYPLGGEERFVRAVLEGRNSRGMPPWGGLLIDVQARSIFAYVHALVPVIETAPNAPLEEQARQVFGQICATCHGAEGGGTRIAPSLQAFKGTDEQFIGTVLDGRQGTAMAPYRSVFSPEVARKIREYVRALARTN
jgi:ABC-type amino acid transport substrate-binding protein/mono/diheme cytochrome c family protein